MIIIEQAKQELASLRKQLESLGEALDIENLEKQRAELAAKQEADGFWEDLEHAQKVNKEMSRIEGKIERYRRLCSKADDIEVLIELCLESQTDSESEEIQSELDSLAKEIEQTTLETLLKGKYDANNAIMTLHAGAGGTEAQDWVSMLYRMYTRYAERNGYKVTVLDSLPGDEAGIKSVTFSVEGENAYGYLKAEKGVHRLVRISPFDSQSRRHTSFASVEVMPEIEGETEIKINPEDLKIDTYRSGGAGGQHINKTDSAVRITHLPTGIVVCCEDERSQVKNKDKAMKVLRARVYDHFKTIADKEQADRRKSQVGTGDRSERIRTYNFPQGRVTDHRIGLSLYNITDFMNGDIGGMLDALKMAEVAEKLGEEKD